MPANGGPGTVKMRAVISLGIFSGEFQVTVQLGEDREIHLNVSEDFVEVPEPPTADGVNGFLKVDIIEKEGSQFLVALPGEVQGAPNRVKLSRGMLQVA